MVHVYRSGSRDLAAELGMINTHALRDCLGEFCVLHNPSKHHMRTWRAMWRTDTMMVEWICPHDIGHPDPDCLQFYDLVYGSDIADGVGTHGCDGCCRKDP